MFSITMKVVGVPKMFYKFVWFVLLAGSTKSSASQVKTEQDSFGLCNGDFINFFSSPDNIIRSCLGTIKAPPFPALCGGLTQDTNNCVALATCYFKTLISVAEPFGYHGLLDMYTLRNPIDLNMTFDTSFGAENWSSNLSYTISMIKESFNNKTKEIAVTYEGLVLNYPKNDSHVLYRNGTSTSCLQECENFNVTLNGCQLDAFCGLQSCIKYVIYTTNGSYKLSFAPYFSIESIVREMYKGMRLEQLRLDTFLCYVMSVFNTMLEILQFDEDNQYQDIPYVLRKECLKLGFEFILSSQPVGAGPSSLRGLDCDESKCFVRDDNSDCRQDNECFLRLKGYY